MALCHKPPAQNLIALSPSNYVCACCQNGNWGTKTKVRGSQLKVSSQSAIVPSCAFVWDRRPLVEHGSSKYAQALEALHNNRSWASGPFLL